jgi:DNA (cytosine-5)-methyltransferase 1
MKKLIKIGSQFSGVGAFEQALNRLCVEHKNIYAADWDKYARQTYLLNFEEPEYYIKDVNDTPTEQITEKHGSLDLAMFSPPCQAFSLAGKRLGEKDNRGILFYNSHEFIKINKPRFFIFENVKGLLSDNSGKTFGTWIELLGGKSVNGNSVMFPHDEAVPYHIYWKVLNAKNYNIPQNRERVFIVGIRDDVDNYFNWPQEVPLTKRLKDVLEDEVDEKYFLSDKMLDYLTSRKDNFNNGNINFKDENSVASTITKSSSSLDISDNILKLGNVNPSGNGMNGNVFSENGICPSLTTNKGEGIKIGTWRTHEDGKGFREMEDKLCPTIPARAREDGSGQPVLKIHSNTSKGYEIATEEDSINFSVPSSKTRRGRVGKGVSQTLDTACNQGVMVVGNLEGKNEHNNRVYSTEGISPTLLAGNNGGGQSPVKHLTNGYRIRRLTPLECFKLMDFNFGIPGVKDFIWDVSDSQAYKQAGNSICVGVLAGIISKLNFNTTLTQSKD